MIKTMADNGTLISSLQDALLYGSVVNTDYIISDYEGELAMTTTGLTITFDDGQAIIQGRTINVTGGETLEVDPNTSGYIVLRYDLTQATGYEGRFDFVPSFVANDLNNGGSIRDLVLATYTSDASDVTITADIRPIMDNNIGWSIEVDTGDWSYNGVYGCYTATISIYAMNNIMRPIVFLGKDSLSASDIPTYESEFAKIINAVSGARSLTLWASEIPSVDLPIFVRR